MNPVPVLHVHRAVGQLQYRLELPGRPTLGPVRQLVTQSMSDEAMAALQAGTTTLLRSTPSTTFSTEVEAWGTLLYRNLVPEDLRHDLEAIAGPLLISTSRYSLPFEVFRSDEFWGLRYALVREVLLDRVPRARDGSRRKSERLQILIITADPHGDLSQVRIEGERLFDGLQEIGDVYLLGADSTFDNVVRRLGEGFDVVHYCGHIVRRGTDERGLLLGDGRVLSGSVIERTLAGSPVVFLNGCAPPSTDASKSNWEEDISSAKYGFIQGGARAVVGTSSDVSDLDAAGIAIDFYRRAAEGVCLGDALRGARQHGRAVAPNSPVWLSFVLYGNPTHVLRTDRGAAVASSSRVLPPPAGARAAVAPQPQGPHEEATASRVALLNLAPRNVRWWLILLLLSCMGGAVWWVRASRPGPVGTVVFAAEASATDGGQPPRCSRPLLSHGRLETPVWVCVTWFGLSSGQLYLVKFRVRDGGDDGELRYEKSHAFTAENDVYHVAWKFEPAGKIFAHGEYVFEIDLDGRKRLERTLAFLEESAPSGVSHPQRPRSEPSTAVARRDPRAEGGADDAKTPHPWDGPGRGGYVEAAVRQIFALDEVPDLTMLPDLCVGTCPRSLYLNPDVIAADQELHVVGVYEGEEPRVTEDGRVVPQPVRVVVRATSKPISLFLMGYSAVTWEIQVEAGIGLSTVYYSGHESGAVRVTGALVSPSIIRVGKSFSAYEYESVESEEGGAKNLFPQIGGIAGRPVTSFQGEYRGKLFNVPWYYDASIVVEILDTHARHLSDHSVDAPGAYFLVLRRTDQGSVIAHVGTSDPDVVVPYRLNAVTYAEVNGKLYGVADHGLVEIDRESGDARDLAPPSDYPELSWLGGITYDAKLHRLVITTRWHSGFHHLYDPISGDWRVVPIERSNGGLFAAAYQHLHGVIYGLGRSGLGVYDSQLRFIEHLDLDHAQMLTADHHHSVQMAAVKEDLVVCRGVGRHRRAQRGQEPDRCLVVSLPSQEVRRLRDVSRATERTGNAGVRR